MEYLNKKINLKNIFFSTSPGLISILLTFLSLPIYLRYLPTSEYSTFLISHIFLSLSLVFNFNIGKIASIKIQNKSKKNKNIIIFNALALSLMIAIISSLILVFFLSKIFNNDENINFLLIYFGLVISILFINSESISKGLGKFKITAFSNLIFYGFSISGPSFVILLNLNLINQSLFDLFTISIFFKIISLLIIIISIQSNLFKENELNIKIFLSFREQSFWMTLSNSYNQIFDYLDKYLIKIFLSPLVFVNYTISQQIASKISIFSGAIISVMLPKLASQKSTKNKKNVLNLHLYLFYIPISLFLVFFEFSFDELLRWWLKDSFNQNFYVLFTIFLVLTFVSCQSQILISLYEVKEITKKNSLFETFIIIPFIYALFLIVSKGDVILICYLILIKEIILFLIRFFYLKKYIICFNLYFFSIFIFLMFWILKIYDLNYLSIIIKVMFFLSISMLIYYLIGIYKKKLLYT
tara:strand:- start:104 stop:1513 length:1410 start_codon:yes stop_codon:yes gene_type:complete